jgi:drug/metabolite transporter (DMT)-like permease
MTARYHPHNAITTTPSSHDERPTRRVHMLAASAARAWSQLSPSCAALLTDSTIGARCSLLGVQKSYGVSSMAMMLYANLFSSAFTALGLLVTLEIVEVLDYFERNPSILPHMFLMAICSAIGQLFIFHTIKRFGPLVFATIQTVRQFLSVVLSIVFFAHPLNAMEAVGIAIVFVALGGQIVQKWLSKRGPHAKRPLPPTPPNDEIAAAPPDVDNPKASLLRTTERTGSRSLD